MGSWQPAQRLASFSEKTVGMRMPMIWPPRKRVAVTGRSYQRAATLGSRLAAAGIDRLPTMQPPDQGAPSPEPDDRYSQTEIALAGRNRGMPLEMLRHDITPVGMHYMLTHFDIPDLEPATWRLEIDGLVETPLSLRLVDLRARASRSLPVTLECAGNGRALLSPRPRNQPWRLEAIGTAEWTGVPLREVLDAAGVRPEAVELVFSGADEGTQGGVRHHYQRSLSVPEASRPEVILAWAMNGRPLEPQHGAPLRLVVPGWYGMASVKWLTRIEAVAEPFRGYQQARSYNLRQTPNEPGTPVARMRVRALMIPPGQPDFPSLERTAAAGRTVIRGRAWSGEAPVARVEVAVDGEWAEARLDPPAGDFAWRGWSFDWQATPGRRRLSCRATDAAGGSQPLEQVWNVGGYCNNMVQTVELTVE
jgi:sulfane dehydrogenase subunit SoxC